MRHWPILASLLAVLAVPSSATSSPQAAKKPKGPLSAAIDSTAGGLTGGAKQSPLAEDGEFLRRVMLDLVGYPPSLAEVKAFIADPDVNKRAVKIDALLETEDWADRTARLAGRAEVALGPISRQGIERKRRTRLCRAARIAGRADAAGARRRTQAASGGLHVNRR